MRIVADENIPGLEVTFGQFGDIFRLNGRQLRPSDLKQADVLLVRSVSRIDRTLLAGSSVRFVGSATIGTDHIDSNYLQNAGIHWCHAPGCNADAAAQYSLAMILLAVQRAGLDLAHIRAGIVGMGNVGSRLFRLLSLMKVGEAVACDPPLAQAGKKGLVNMETIADCDLISFHVPLTHKGPHSTAGLGNEKFFSSLKHGTLLINSSRGDVLEAAALQQWLSKGKGQAALDVWPGEPNIAARLLNHVTVATPHVAGYSLDGKLNGTRMIFSQFLEWQGIKPPKPIPPLAPPPESLSVDVTGSVTAAVLASCPVEADDRAFRDCLSGKGQITAVEFDALRKNYAVRRDFTGKQLPRDIDPGRAKTLESLGFNAGSL